MCLDIKNSNSLHKIPPFSDMKKIISNIKENLITNYISEIQHLLGFTQHNQKFK